MRNKTGEPGQDTATEFSGIEGTSEESQKWRQEGINAHIFHKLAGKFWGRSQKDLVQWNPDMFQALTSIAEAYEVRYIVGRDNFLSKSDDLKVLDSELESIAQKSVEAELETLTRYEGADLIHKLGKLFSIDSGIVARAVDTLALSKEIAARAQEHINSYQKSAHQGESGGNGTVIKSPEAESSKEKREQWRQDGIKYYVFRFLAEEHGPASKVGEFDPLEFEALAYIAGGYKRRYEDKQPEFFGGSDDFQTFDSELQSRAHKAVEAERETLTKYHGQELVLKMGKLFNADVEIEAAAIFKAIHNKHQRRPAPIGAEQKA